MPKSTAYRIKWSSERQVYECSENHGQVRSILPDDYRQLQEWLSRVSSFAFSGKVSSCTIRRESAQQEHGYWYAYHRNGKRVQKKYLGKSEAITISQLEHVTSLFASAPATPTKAAEEIPTLQQHEAVQRDDLILETKLRIPPPPPHALPRLHLLERLQVALTRPLTLLSAAAGAGKSTLLSSWLSQQTGMRAGWITLERDDNEPGRLWRLIFTAFERLCPGTGEGPLTLLRTRRQPNRERMLTTLLNQLAASKQELVLVLDDYHYVSDPELSQGMAFLLEHLPGHIHVIISTRLDPPLPLARLRMQEQLLELRGADLYLLPGEIRAFLNRNSKLTLSGEEIDMLFAHTEGWIAGLQLIAILLKQRATSTDIIKALSAGHRYIADYLVQEVLEHLPAHIQHFLLATSVLERLQGKLCEAVTGQADGQTTLAWLEQANLFLIPLDDERQWYRYHHLFAETLRQLLLQREPELVTVLHRRAMCWFKEQGMVAEAIGHAREIGDVVTIATLLETAGMAMIMHNEVASIMPWVNLLSKETLFTHPVLFVYVCWDMIAINRYPAAVDMLQEYAHFHQLPTLETTDADHLEQAICTHTLTSMTSQTHLDEKTKGDIISHFLRLYGTLVVLRDNRVAFGQELSSRASAHAQRLNRGDKEQSWLITLWRGDVSGAIKRLEEELSAMLANKSNILGFAIISTLTHMLSMTGQLHKTTQIAHRVLRSEKTTNIRMHHGPAYVALGIVAYEWNNLEQAENYLQRGIALCQQFDSVEAILNGLYKLVKIRLLRGDEAGAKKLLQENEGILKSIGEDSTDLSRALAAWRAQVAMIQGDIRSAHRWIQEIPLEADPTQHLNPILEGCYLLQARLLLSLSRWSEADRLLQTLSMAAETQKRRGSLLKIHTLQAVLYQAQGKREQALDMLACALSYAEAEGYQRTLLDEGTPILTLLTELRQVRHNTKGSAQHDASTGYLDHLISSLSRELEERNNTYRDDQLPLEQLSKREREILQLMSEGKSNREIAQQLVIAVSTVKSHLHTIYGKLQVQSRTQAIICASTRHLL
ncbi:MAG TPA: LuxR C-terminal-related transcriptional regulator [Ktedonobacteraceae bacterium]|nr:LuxR C-terminal-related transcriptional regulator [Ktedonobacteraceae bacterium]